MANYDIDLCYLTATEVINRFKDRTLSPVELMKALISRVEDINPTLNAITYRFFDRAIEEAKKAELSYGKSDQKHLRALEGVPVAIKDFHPVKDEITTFGSYIFDNFRPTYTAPTVDRLLSAGAIMHFRTTTPEFAYSGQCHSPRWGITRNPWNIDFAPGGSSGGAGASVAAGMTTIADGTDGGGSIRIPASVCGIVGFKPPFGRNPLDRDHPGESILKYGPMTRSVADAALMQNVMSGPHIEDRYTLDTKITIPTTFEDIKGLKIAFSMDLGYFPIDPEVRKNTLNTLDVFRDLGCEVTEVDLDWHWDNLSHWLIHWESLFATVASQYLPRYRFHMDPIVVGLLERGLRHSATDLYRVNLHRGEMHTKLASIMKDYDCLVCPTTAVPSVPVDHDQSSPNFVIEGQRIDATYGWFLTNPFNLTSQCPVMSVPSGFSSSGVPTGIQIVGRYFDDVTVFRVSSAYETARPWNNARPTV